MFILAHYHVCEMVLLVLVCVMDARALVYLNYYLSACYEYQMAS
jgi:hypothetical protein